MIINFLDKIFNNKSIIVSILKKIIKRFPYLKSSALVKLNSTERPAYAYCLYHAARLAKKLNYKSFSVIEFGVAGGNGLYFIEKFSNKISKELNINIEVYGFTLEKGLSSPVGYKDLPYWFASGYFSTDKEKLTKKLKTSKIIFGDVKETTKNFFNQYNPAPLGVVFNDLDYYSSTINSFNIFLSEMKNYLPRIFCYFDDIIGDEIEMYGEYTGELAAIKQFNSTNLNKKFSLNQNLLARSNEPWRYQIYYYHNFEHPQYNIFIATEEQLKQNKELNLKK
jgi:hypothetical protein